MVQAERPPTDSAPWGWHQIPEWETAVLRWISKEITNNLGLITVIRIPNGVWSSEYWYGVEVWTPWEHKRPNACLCAVYSRDHILTMVRIEGLPMGFNPIRYSIDDPDVADRLLAEIVRLL